MNQAALLCPALGFALLTACGRSPAPSETPVAVVVVPNAAPTIPQQNPTAPRQSNPLQLLAVVDQLDPLAALVLPPDEAKLITERVSCGGASRCTVHYLGVQPRAGESIDAARVRLLRVLDGIEAPEGCRWAVQAVSETDERGRSEQLGWRSYLLEDKTIVQASDVARAWVRQADSNEPEPGRRPTVHMQLTEPASRRFRDYTRKNLGTRIAILIDGVVEVAPVIASEITGELTLTFGSDSRDRAQHLVDALRASSGAE